MASMDVTCAAPDVQWGSRDGQWAAGMEATLPIAFQAWPGCGRGTSKEVAEMRVSPEKPRNYNLRVLPRVIPPIRVLE
jgi:hypothetical protein